MSVLGVSFVERKPRVHSILIYGSLLRFSFDSPLYVQSSKKCINLQVLDVLEIQLVLGPQ